MPYTHRLTLLDLRRTRLLGKPLFHLELTEIYGAGRWRQWVDRHAYLPDAFAAAGRWQGPGSCLRLLASDVCPAALLVEYRREWSESEYAAHYHLILPEEDPVRPIFPGEGVLVWTGAPTSGALSPATSGALPAPTDRTHRAGSPRPWAAARPERVSPDPTSGALPAPTQGSPGQDSSAPARNQERARPWRGPGGPSMSEEIGCTVVFGGKIPRSRVAAIEAAARDEIDGAEIDLARDAARRLSCTVEGVANYGNPEHFLALLQELGLPYRWTSDAKYEYDGSVAVYDPVARAVLEEGATQNGEPYLTLSDLRALTRLGGTLADAVARLAWVDPALPGVEILEDGHGG